jgi:predicted permease
MAALGSSDATHGLVLALFSTFAVIVLGFLLAKMQVITAVGQKMLGALLVRLILPALILNSMATLDFKCVATTHTH